jgi:hypothetical protein
LSLTPEKAQLANCCRGSQWELQDHDTLLKFYIAAKNIWVGSAFRTGWKHGLEYSKRFLADRNDYFLLLNLSFLNIQLIYPLDHGAGASSDLE